MALPVGMTARWDKLAAALIGRMNLKATDPPYHGRNVTQLIKKKERKKSFFNVWEGVVVLDGGRAPPAVSSCSVLDNHPQRAPPAG